MGFHICITNEDAVKVNLNKLVYGNVGNDNESPRVIWGKIRDLYAVKPGDYILLYVKHPASYFLGVYEVTSMPYICYDNLFNDPNQIYPYRFYFRVKYNFINPVPSFEFYSLVESGKINSLITLSRDVNDSYRGIRQLFEIEFDEILNVFYKYNAKTEINKSIKAMVKNTKLKQIEAIKFDTSNISKYKNPTQIQFNKIPNSSGIALFENQLHTYILYNLLHDLNNVSEQLGFKNFNELIIEAPVFKSMQFRADILATFKYNGRIVYYSFVELKRATKIGISEISQLIGYLKSFAASRSLPVNSYDGVYISSKFDQTLIDYLENRKIVEKESIISLVSYTINKNGTVNLTKIV